MTIHYDFVWPPVDFEAVSKYKDLAAERELFLDGTLFDNVTNQISFIAHGYSRSVSITSTDVDNSGVTFTVIGTQNGVPVSEDITGADANQTAFGTLAFDIITSITSDGLAQNFAVGTGLKGWFPIIKVDSSVHTYMMQCVFQGVFVLPDVDTLKYQIYTTLADIPKLGRSYDDLLENSTYLIISGGDVIEPGFFNLTALRNYYVVKVIGTVVENSLELLYSQIR
jgi:hypothetical protein